MNKEEFEGMSEDEIEEYYEATLDSMLETIRNLPQEKVTILNVPRYAEVMQAIEEIISMVKAYDPETEFDVHFDPLLGTSLMLMIKTDEFNIYKMKDFCKFASAADIMEIYPTTNGKLHIGFTFGGVQIFVPTADD